MVLMASKAPFKRTLHASVRDVHPMMGTSLIVQIDCADQASMAPSENATILLSHMFAPPRLPSLNSMQISSVTFNSHSEGLCANAHAKSGTASAYTLFMQLLDSHDRPCSAAVALATGAMDVTMNVSVALHPSDRVCLYLAVHAPSNDSKSHRSLPASVTLTCQAYLASAMTLLKKASSSIKKLHVWSVEDRTFCLEGQGLSGDRQAHPEVAGRKRRTSRERGGCSDDDGSEQQAPPLIYAYVPGGDDES